MSTAETTNKLIWLLLAFGLWLAPAGARAETPIRLQLEGEVQPTHVCVISTARSPGTRRLAELESDYRVLQHADGVWTLGDAAALSSPGSKITDVQALLGLDPKRSAYGDECRTSEKSSLHCRPSFDQLDGDEEHFIQCVANQSGAPKDLPGADKNLRLLVVSVEDAGPRVEDKIAITNVKLFDSILEFDSSHKPSVATMLLSVRGGYYLGQPAVRVDDKGEAQLVLEPRCRWLTLDKPQAIPDETKAGRKLNIRVEAVDREDTRSTVEPHNGDIGEDYKHHCLSGGIYKSEIKILVPARVDEARVEVELVTPKQVRAEAEPGRSEAPNKPENPKNPGDHSYDGILLSAQWTGTTPERLLLETHNFTFSWLPSSCFYLPNARCPDASIYESGVECTTLSRPGEHVCRYSCPSGRDPKRAGRDPTDLSINFVNPGSSENQAWVIELNYIDQKLAGYVDGKEQVVRVELDDEYNIPPNRARIAAKTATNATNDQEYKWQRGPANVLAAGDQVYAVELEYIGNTGTPTVVTVDLADGRPVDLEAIVANVPDATCGRDIRYRYIGERSYVPGQTTISSGAIKLGSPIALGRQWYFVTLLGGGFIIPRRLNDFGAVKNPRLYPNVNVELGFSYWALHYYDRGRQKKCDLEQEPGTKQGPACQPEAKGRGIRVETRAWFNYSTVPVQPLDGEALGSSSPYFRKIPYFRVGASVTVLPPWFGFGVSPRATVSQREWPQFTIGPGFGVFVGRPVRQADTNLFDRSVGVDFGLRGHVEGRIRLSYKQRIELFARHEYYFLEDKVGFSTDGRGQPMQHLRENAAIRQGAVFGLSISL